MLKYRLIAGTLMAAGVGAVLYFDAALAPNYPGLLAVVLLAGALAAREFRLLLPADAQPPAVLTAAGVVLVLAANWWHPVLAGGHDVAPLPRAGGPWEPVVWAFAGVVLAAFLDAMLRYREPGANTARVGNTVLAVAYLGLLPSFFLKLRWLPADSGVALLLTIFVPKVGDIGAYFAGRFLGRRQFSPRLSPKKTWAGFAGGLLAAAGTAVGLGFAAPVFPRGWPEAAGFGVAVGLAGVFGDLAESMVKRDALAKDAAKSIPGFGGVLDVIDSVVFAGPVAYLWLSRPANFPPGW